jgi:hypothetical protein
VILLREKNSYNRSVIIGLFFIANIFTIVLFVGNREKNHLSITANASYADVSLKSESITFPLTVSEISYKNIGAGIGESGYIYEYEADFVYPQIGVTAIDTFYSELLKSAKAHSETDIAFLINTVNDGNNAVEADGRHIEIPFDYDKRVPLCITETRNYEIKYNNGNVFSVVHESYYLESNLYQPHGMIYISCDNFQVSDGSQIQLTDLFDIASDVYLKRINNAANEYIMDQIQNPREFRIGFFGSDYTQANLISNDNINFCITPNGLEFYFEPMTIADYVSGIITIPIPRETISDIVNPLFFLQ